MEEFGRAVEAALASIPPPFDRYLESVEVVVAERSREGLLGLYEGATALESEWELPPRITVYKREHEAEAASWEALVDEVRRTILHEAGHHFGMSEDELPY